MRIFAELGSRWLLVGMLALLLVGGVSCAAREQPKEIFPAPAPAPSPSPRPASSLPPPEIALRPPPSVHQELGETSERLVIRTASMDIVVSDFTEAAEAISALAEGLGGYTVSSRITERAVRAVSRITIRVPAEKLDEALQAIRELAREVKTVDTNSQDITEEFTDLQSQLRNLEAGEDQFLKIMERAETVEETLQVQRELTSIRGQIERVKGRIKYLEGNVRESRITVTLRLSPEAKPIATTGWSIIETLRSAARGLIIFGRFLVDIAVWLAIFSPVGVALGLVALYLRRRWRRARS